VGDRYGFRLGRDLVSVGRAEAGEDEKHDGLRKAIEIPHLAAAGLAPQQLSMTAVVFASLSHGDYL